MLVANDLWSSLVGFLRARHLTRPDGRALWAYKCTKDELSALTIRLREVLNGRPPKENGTGDVNAVFCLVSSEWWRRNHEAGRWSWEGTLESLGLGEHDGPALYVSVRRGLSYWRRAILRPHGRNEYLVTLACEGGLPLKLVHKEGASLRRYFKALLREFADFRDAGKDPAEIAQSVARLLPTRLQQDPVYRLCGDLVDAIWDLKGVIGGSPTPVLDLDAKYPNWRDRLPLVVEDAEARALLSDLVEQAGQLIRQRSQGIRLVRSIQRDGDSWRLQARLSLPQLMSARRLEELFAFDAASGLRCQLYTCEEGGDPSPLALLTEVAGADASCDEGSLLALEIWPRARIFWQDEKATRCLQLFLDAGGQAREASPQNGSQLSDLPWVFVECSDETGRFRLLGEGSPRTRNREAMVAIPTDHRWEPLAESQVDACGTLNGVDRAILRVRGGIEVSLPGGGKCRIRTACSEEDEVEYRVVGKRAHHARSDHRTYIGIPTVAVNTAGCRQLAVSPRELEWKPIAGGNWNHGVDTAVGEITVRHAVEGIVRYQARIAVVPPNSRITLRQGSSFRDGCIDLVGFGNASFGWSSIPGVTITKKIDNDRCSLRCQANADELPMIPVAVSWPGSGTVHFHVPFPARGGFFQGRSDALMRRGASVPIADLAGMRAVGTSPRDHEDFVLDGKLQASDADHELLKSLDLEAELTAKSDGVWEFEMRRIQERVQDALATSNDLDAVVTLRIQARRGSQLPPRRLEVRRFGLGLSFDKDKDEIWIADRDAGELSDVAAQHLRMEARLLSRPRQPEEVLEALGAGRWRFPLADRAAGPWLLTAWEGSVLRTRPCLWSVAPNEGIGNATDNALGEAVTIKDEPERRAALERVIAEITEDPDSPLWDDLFAFVKLSAVLPPNSLDVTRALTVEPVAAVSALLMAKDDVFDVLWRLPDRLPFSWELLPLAAWTRAARRITDAQREHTLALSHPVPTCVDIFTARASGRPGLLGLLQEWLSVQTGRQELSATAQLRVAFDPMGREILVKALREGREYHGLRVRHAEDQWPLGARVMEWAQREWNLPQEFTRLFSCGSGHRKPVQNAPLVAAAISLTGTEPSRPVAYQIKRFRKFDPRWFDHAYTLALALGIGAMGDAITEAIA